MVAFFGLLSFFGFVVFVAGLIWGIVCNFKKQSGKRQYLYAMCGFAAFLICVLFDAAFFPADAKTQVATTPAIRHLKQPAHRLKAEQKAVKVAPARPSSIRQTDVTPTVEQRKAAFLANVDESISISDIAGGPYKYVGDRVDLHGAVGNIIDEGTLDLVDSAGSAVVVIGADTSSLQTGQSLRVVGIVSKPIEGTNVMGGRGNFAAVTQYYVQCANGSLNLEC